MDGNNQIYLIAFDVGKKEDHAVWCSFLTKFKNCIGEVAELAIMSYQHHVIYTTIVKVFPNYTMNVLVITFLVTCDQSINVTQKSCVYTGKQQTLIQKQFLRS